MYSKDSHPNKTGDEHTIDLGRRRSILGFASGIALVAIGDMLTHGNTVAAASETGDSENDILIVRFSAAGQRLGEAHVPKVIKTTAEWQKQLPHNAFVITRRAGTERAFSGEYWDLKADGLYRCRCCDTALYDSRTKFHSGTGWPSFWQPIAQENVVEKTDSSLGMTRTAIACKRCDAHLGHVFNDGPEPTGLRYCMNSAALHFIERAQT